MPVVQPINAHAGALWAARLGFRVFRVIPGGKDPYRGGVNEATRDEATINRWFRENPALNYAIAIDRGYVALDCDATKPGFHADYLSVAIVRTLEFNSGNGGRHLLYRIDFEASQKDLAHATSINVRSTGGYIVGPGSVLANGGRYTIYDDAPAAACPPEVAHRIGRRGEKAEDNTTPVAELDTTGALKWAEAFLAREPGADQGGRNRRLFLLACQLKDKGVSRDTALALLLDAWCPKCSPPYDEEDQIEKTVASAYENGMNPPGLDAAEAQFEDVSGDPDLLRWQGMLALAADRPLETPTKPAGCFVLLDLAKPVSSIPRRPWLFQGDLLRRSLTGLIAPGGVGKSALALNIAIAATIGNGAFLGMRYVEAAPVNVLAVMNEDEYDELLMRVHASCIANGIDPNRVVGRFHVFHDPSGGRFLAMTRHEKKMVRGARLAELERYSLAHAIGLTIFDPFVELHDGEENSNSDIAAVMAGLRGSVRKTNSAGIVIHHTGKPPIAASDHYVGNADAGRGASAFRGSVRRLMTLYPATKDDAERYGLTTQQARRRLRLDDGKASYSALGDEPRWFEQLSVSLENGETAVALRRVDMRDQENRHKVTYFEFLAPQIEAAGGSVPPGTAGKWCAENPIGGGKSKTTLTDKLRVMFAEASPVGGKRLVYDPGGGSPGDGRLVLEAHP